MKKMLMLCGKPFVYELEKVEQRISYYELEIETNPNRGNLHVTNALLKYWKNYKSIHYPNE
jgi:hypothetical protein